jgi:hypothetical protein
LRGRLVKERADGSPKKSILPKSQSSLEKSQIIN